MKVKHLIFAFALMWCGAAASEAPVCVSVNGSIIKTEEPILENGVTYVPLRFAGEALGADGITWDGAARTATADFGGKTLEFTVDSSTARVNGKTRETGAKTRLVNSRTYIPVRFLAEETGSSVDWNQQYYRVEITKEGYSVPAEAVAEKDYDDEHIYWLAKIIGCESGGEPLAGQVAVGNVILNRVNHSDFPNTIYGVIFDDNYGIQFQPVLDGSINTEPVQSAYLAAKLALEGENYAGESLYFLNPRTATNFWIPASRTFFTTIGNHDFYL